MFIPFLTALWICLIKKNYSPISIHGYISRVAKYFAYNDISIDRTKFKAKVVMPRVQQPDDRAPSVEELRRILSWGKLRTKALILFLVSSGMRIGEAIKIKVKDVDFNSIPTRIRLSPQTASKTGQGRTVYISREATEYIKDYLGPRLNETCSWLFVSEVDNSKPMGEDRAWRTITDCIEKAGLGISKETTACNRRKLHPHSFRKFFFSRVVGIIGETAAHALMGHGTYLQTYYRRTEQERAQDYLRCMPYLTIIKESPEVSATLTDTKLITLRALAQAIGIDPVRVRIERQKQLGKELPKEAEILAIQNELNLKLAKQKDPLRKVILESELEDHLANGWNIQTVLASGKLLLSKEHS